MRNAAQMPDLILTFFSYTSMEILSVTVAQGSLMSQFTAMEYTHVLPLTQLVRETMHRLASLFLVRIHQRC